MGHWYIKRPHAIERFRVRGGFPEDMDNIILESELRKALNEAETKQQFLKGCRPGQFAVRIDIPNRNTVFAILQPTPGKGYTHIVPTVLTKAMYEVWHDDVNFEEPSDPRLTPFETVPKEYPESHGKNGKNGKNGSNNSNGDSEKKETPALKPTLFLAYRSEDGLVVNEYVADEVVDQVLQLVESGVPFKTIKVLREIPLKLDVRLGVTR